MEMKFELTLKQLRDNKACVNGYNKVVSALKGIEYDCDKETYIRFKHDEPISLISILETNGFNDALWCLRCNREWDRDSRLFAVWCARQVQHLMIDERSINALDVAERFANGNATQEELAAARDAAWAAARASAWAAARGAAWDAARDAAWASARDAARHAARGATWDAAWGAARADAWDAAWHAAWGAAMDAARGAAWGATWDAAMTAAMDAARDAARHAAWGATWDAALDAQKEMFIKMCKGESPWQSI